MKRGGILHSELARCLARLGHTDAVVVADCGLPVPDGVPRVDLAVRFGLPRFLDVLDAVLDEIVVEAAVAAREVETANPECAGGLRARLSDVELVPHEELKARTRLARFVVRTGEARPYANVLLRCGVPF